jgi:hypothetical protein
MVVGFTTTYMMFGFRIPLRASCTTLCDDVCQWLTAGRWFSPCTPVSSTNKSDRNDITEILMKVALNTIKPNISKLFIQLYSDECLSAPIQSEITQFELRELSNILSSSTIYYQQYYFYNYINVIYDQWRIFHWENRGCCLG